MHTAHTDYRAAALDAAADAVADAAPGLPSLDHAAERLSQTSQISLGTARNLLREAADDGQLHELTPDHDWNVTLPGHHLPGLRVVLAARTRPDGTPLGTYLALTRDPHPLRPTDYGPGHTTLISTPERTHHLAHDLAQQTSLLPAGPRDAALLRLVADRLATKAAAEAGRGAAYHAITACVTEVTAMARDAANRA